MFIDFPVSVPGDGQWGRYYLPRFMVTWIKSPPKKGDGITWYNNEHAYMLHNITTINYLLNTRYTLSIIPESFRCYWGMAWWADQSEKQQRHFSSVNPW